MLFLIFFGSNIVIAQTLKHSYTFEDGTADDVVGGVDGVLHGDAVIEDGSLILSGTGFVALSGKEINIPAYESVTVEVLFTQVPDFGNPNTNIFAFGRFENDWMGTDYFIYQSTRDDRTNRTSVSTGNNENPWATETGVHSENMVTDTNKHYAVCIVTPNDISFYFDGKYIGTEAFTGNNSLATISSDTALIGSGVYRQDPKWQGAIHEFNIYEGVFSSNDVEQRFLDIMGEDFFESRLASLTTSRGIMDPVEFDSNHTDYEIYVPYGTTSLRLFPKPLVGGASVKIFDFLGFEMPSDGTIDFDENGIDLEINVTALDGLVSTTYYVGIFHDEPDESAILIDIELSAGVLSPEFSQDIFEYQVIAPNGIGSVELTAIPGWENANVEGDGVVEIVDGTGKSTIVVTSEDGKNSNTYTLDIYESVITTDKYFYIQHESSGLVIGESGEEWNKIRIYRPIINEPDQLFMFEDSGVEGQYFLRNQNNNYISLVPDNEWDMAVYPELKQEADSCRFEFLEFEPGRFHILLVGRAAHDNKYLGTDNNNVGGGIFSNKSTSSSLAVWSVRIPADLVGPYDTNLADLSASIGEEVVDLNPVFNLSHTEYYLTLPEGTTSLTIDAEPRNPNATVVGTGTIDLENEGVIVITVKAEEDAEYFKEYNINYFVEQELVLRHSYTFADGTAKDVIGGAHGIINGGVIENGVFKSKSDDDYIILPAEEIAINNFPSITLEAYVYTDGENPGYTMLSYFGGLNGSNSFWMQLTRGDNHSQFEIATGETSKVEGPQPEMDMYHHYIVVLTNDYMSVYIDGSLIGQTAMLPNSYIGGISTENAWLGKGGYPDPTWLGSLFEFNIYAGIMDEQTIALRSTDFPQDDESSIATLSDLTVNGETIEGFHYANLNYSLIVSGNEIPVVDAVVSYEGASYVVDNASEIPGTTNVVVTAEDGSTTNTYTIEFIADEETKFETQTITKSIIVYPTVSSGDFYFEGVANSALITIYDMSGRIYKKLQASNAGRSFSIENNGIYIVTIESEGALQWFKVIKSN